MPFNKRPVQSPFFGIYIHNYVHNSLSFAVLVVSPAKLRAYDDAVAATRGTRAAKTELEMFLRKEVRTIHLIDGENLAGGPSRMPCRPDLGNQYRMAAKPADDDLVVVGSDITNMFFGAAWFPGARLVTGRGQSGADFALMRSNTVGWLADRVGTVVVASGDGDFALFARACRVAGIRVVVVARRSSVSWALLRSADTFVPFPEWGDNEMAMASAAGSGASSVLTDRTGATDDQAAA